MNKHLFLIMVFFVFLSACQKDDENKKAEWIKNAFESMESGKYPRVKAISWWHEDFDKSYLKINSSEASLEAYRNGVNADFYLTTANFENGKLCFPQTGMLHSAYPDFGGTEDEVSADRIFDFESLAGKKIVWAYFSNNWYDEIKFPTEAVNIIHSAGRIPFIRMMPRTNFDEGGPDPNYTMQRIIDGDFDEELTQWAKDAANTGFPLLVEFGTEVNGDWFPWNGEYNGGSETTAYGDETLADGPERFVDAYRHIIDICNENGATNITWFFHINADSEPQEAWNDFENYYPGDEYIDWMGVSVYGPQEKNEEYREFSEILDEVYERLTDLSDKPIAVLEFAVTEM